MIGWKTLSRSCVTVVVAAACLLTPVTTANAIDGGSPGDETVTRQVDQGASTIATTQGDADADVVDSGSGATSDGDAASGSPAGTDASGGTHGGTESGSSGASGSGNQSAAGNGQQATGQQAQSNSATPAAQDWTGYLDNLQLSAEGLAFTASDGKTASDGATTAKTRKAALPDRLDATLDLSFTLDPSASGGRADGSGSALPVQSDTFEVVLPEHIAADSRYQNGATFDIEQTDEQGKTTGVRIATGVITDGALKITLVEPTIIATGETQAFPSILRGATTLHVTVDSSLVADRPSTVVWTLQAERSDSATDSADTGEATEPKTQTADLAIPSRAELLALLGLDASNDADLERDPSPSPRGKATQAAPVAGATTKKEATGTGGSASFSTYWFDNNSVDRPTVNTIKGEYRLQVKIADGSWIPVTDRNGKITQQAMEALGLTAEDTDDARYLPSLTNPEINVYAASARNLPTTLTTTVTTPSEIEGEPDTVETTEQTLSWRIIHDIDSSGYIADQTYEKANKDYYPNWQENNNREALLLLKDVKLTVVAKNGSVKYSADFNTSGFAMHVASSKTTSPGSWQFDADQIAELITAGKLEATQPTEGENVYTLQGRWAAYNVDGSPLLYSFTYEGPLNKQESTTSPGTYYEDRFDVIHDNTNATNHGNDTTATYSGGTMTIVHAGTTSIHAYKEWLDDDASGRPATTYTLWRYSTNGGTPQSATQVQWTGGGGQQGAYMEVSFTAEENQKAASGERLDIGQKFRDKYGVGQLDKYDPEGYPYVYLVREDDPGNGYERVMGSVNRTTGEATDSTGPNYWNPERDDKIQYSYSCTGNRPEGDLSVYDGGVITNRRHDTTTVKRTKTWIISSFQNQLADVSTTFTAQWRFANATGSNPWRTVKTATEGGESASVTTTLDHWYAENLSQTVSGSFPKYDNWGRELEYRWIETGVTKGDQDTGFTVDEQSGAGAFSFSVTDADGSAERLEFVVSVDAETGEITNEYVNTTDQTVRKYWWDAALNDGVGGWSQEPTDESNRKYPEVTVRLLRNDTLIGEDFSLDGVADLKATPLTDKDGKQIGKATYQETEPWVLTFANLPKYDEHGAKYSYLVDENPVDGWHTEREYDAATRTTTLRNTQGPGETSVINVSKSWNDGGNTSDRKTAVIEVVAKHDMTVSTYATSGFTTPDGTEYAAGETIPAGTVMARVRLDESNNWFDKISFPVGGQGLKDFTIREISLDAMDGSGTSYPVMGRDEAEGLDPKPEWSAMWTDDLERVATEQSTGHVYEVTYRTNDGKRSLEAVNSRLGRIFLNTDKTWKDQGGDKADRPKANLVLSVDGGAGTFGVNDKGEITVTLDGATTVVQTSSEAGNTTDHAKIEALTTGKSGASVKNGKLVMPVDRERDASTYTFWGLPKYLSDGTSVSYSLTEEWADNDEGNEYTIGSSSDAYQVGDWHFTDTQGFHFTNTRTGTKDVTFHTHWWDQYVKEQGKRPDVYLTLYKVNASGEAEIVTGYENYKWNVSGDDSSNPDYQQYATIKGLPKYDENGAEIIYYASVQTNLNDISGYDYVPHDFTYEYLDSSIQPGKPADAKEGTHYIDVRDLQPSSVGEGGDRGKAIREDGTFNFRIANDMDASGEKIWTNIPGNVTAADLPHITVYLQRKLPGESWKKLEITEDASASNGYTVGNYVASTDEFTKSGNRWSYSMTFEGTDQSNPGEPNGRVKLAKYDEYGRMYDYRVREIVDGLKDTPGGFDIDDMLDADTSSDTSVEGVYDITHGMGSSFAIENAYDSNKGRLKVSKSFEGRAEGDNYPDATFTLYRQFETGEQGSGSMSEAAKVAERTIKAEDFTSTTGSCTAASSAGEGITPANIGLMDTSRNLLGGTLASPLDESLQGANNTACTVFDDLDLYAPNGRYWQYFVVETVIGGYPQDTVRVTVTPSGEAVTNADAITATGVASGYVQAQNPEADDFDETAIQVAYTNRYDAGKIDLRAAKLWIDGNDAFKLRPDADKFRDALTMTRTSTKSDVQQTETVALQTNDPDGENYLTVTSGGTDGSGDDLWTIDIKNVERWAPDGTVWRYTLTEDLKAMGALDDYAATWNGTSISVTVPETGPDDGEPVAFPGTNNTNFRNALKKQLTVVKNWVGDNGDGHGVRPTAVTVLLQARVGDSGAWDDAYTVLKGLLMAGDTGMTGEAADAALSRIQISASGVKAVLTFETGSNSWTKHWYDLPLRTSSGKEMQYRAVEIALCNARDDASCTPQWEAPTDGDADNVPYSSDRLGSYIVTQTTTNNSWSETTGYNQSTTTITNTATRFTLDKVNDWAGAGGGQSTERLNGATFQIIGTDGKLYATWSRDTGGTTSSTVWVDGTDAANPVEGDGTAMTDSNAGYIIGLPAGDYTLKETEVPAGHAKAADSTITIAKNGGVTVTDGSAKAETVDGPGGASDAVVKITVTDPVYRAHVVLAKHMDDAAKTPVAGMTFDLYAGKLDIGAANGGGTKIATGITTDADGKWTSKGSDIALLAEGMSAAFGDLAKYYTTLGGGLPAGDYYFLETGASPNTVAPGTVKDKTFAFTLEAATADGNGSHGETVTVNAENPEFKAGISLGKIDVDTGEAITSGVTFKVVYTLPGDSAENAKEVSGLELGKVYTVVPAGGDGYTVSEGDAGRLTLANLKKGTYTLTESANPGYDVDDQLIATFVIDNDDHGTTYKLDSASDRKLLGENLKLADGVTFADGKGLENTPLHGRAKLVKYADKVQDGKELNGATFTLQRKSMDTGDCAQAGTFDVITGGGCWVDAITGLESGKTYVANAANDGVVDKSTTDGDTGVLLIGNLKWGTYRFVETDAAAGYIRCDEHGDPRVSGEFTISAATFEGVATQTEADQLEPVDAGTVINRKAIAALPRSGSWGARIWLIVGAFLFLLATAVMAVAGLMRRKRCGEMG